MEQTGVGSLAVIDDDRIVGIVTDRDLVRRGLALGRPSDARVDGIMSAPVVTIDADDDLHSAFALFRSHAVRRLAVVRDESSSLALITVDDLRDDSPLTWPTSLGRSRARSSSDTTTVPSGYSVTGLTPSRPRFLLRGPHRNPPDRGSVGRFGDARNKTASPLLATGDVWASIGESPDERGRRIARLLPYPGNLAAMYPATRGP